jgi:hypothetical protein
MPDRNIETAHGQRKESDNGQQRGGDGDWPHNRGFSWAVARAVAVTCAVTGAFAGALTGDWPPRGPAEPKAAAVQSCRAGFIQH